MNSLRAHLLEGLVIPALPLALTEDGAWSPAHQRALLRYYLAAGAGGIAAGVHATQFEIRRPEHGLFEPVLRCAIAVLREHGRAAGRRPVAIAGICGKTDPALREADLAMSLGYDAGLPSLAALGAAPEADLLRHCRRLAEVIPLIGFYLQPAVGGRRLSYDFWRSFFEIENVVAVKAAPFNRYYTWDVARAVLDAGRDDVALYTGNDDNIVSDLLTPFEAKGKTRWISGGLLGHWGVWTRAAVRLFRSLREARRQPRVDIEWLRVNAQITDMNAALFDAANGFRGCIPGILEVLRRQRLVPSARTLNSEETLSPGQAEELNRVCAAYPQWTDDDFVRSGLAEWLKG